MISRRRKNLWAAAALFALIFTGLFSLRIGLFQGQVEQRRIAALGAPDNFADKNTWMNIFQGGQKIGFSHASYARTTDGFRFSETVFMRINTMGMVQDISLKSNGVLHGDFSLASFSFEVSSGRFDFIARGSVSATALSLETGTPGSMQSHTIPLQEKIYFTSGIVQAATAADLNPGDSLSLRVFDPVALGQEAIVLSIIGDEEIQSSVYITGYQQEISGVNSAIIGFSNSNQSDHPAGAGVATIAKGTEPVSEIFPVVVVKNVTSDSTHQC